MLLENKFQKKCTKKFSTKTSFDLSQNTTEKKCMPFWHPSQGGSMPNCHATFGGVQMGGSIPQR